MNLCNEEESTSNVIRINHFHRHGGWHISLHYLTHQYLFFVNPLFSNKEKNGILQNHHCLQAINELLSKICIFPEARLYMGKLDYSFDQYCKSSKNNFAKDVFHKAKVNSTF